MSEADLILYNARVLTFDSACPLASLVAIKGEKVLALSTDRDIDRFKGNTTTVVNCEGRTIIPGFNDAHCHPVGFAESLITPDIGPTAAHSITDIKYVIREASINLPAGKWIQSRGYNEFHLAEKRHPTRWDLDKATTTHPVKLTHSSGHAHVLNSMALAIAGIAKDTPDPIGGIIDRDPQTGEPTGVLYDMGDHLSRIIPPRSENEMIECIKLASKKLISLGITSVQDTSIRNDIQRWQTFRRWREQGTFMPRVNMMMGMEKFDEFIEHGFHPNTGDSCLRLSALKIILTETTGQLYPTLEELKNKVLLAHQLGYQVAMHAVERTTVEAARSTLEYVLRKLPRRDHRHRIEHCSVCPPALARQLAELEAVIVTQPAFLYFNGDRYLNTVPRDQLKYLYPLATLIKSGLNMAISSDSPVVSPDPLYGIYAAVSRTSESGQEVLSHEQITPVEALHMYTKGSAYSCFEEGQKGSLSPGMIADIVVLSDNPAEVTPDQIKEIQVEMTIIGGQIVWRKNI